MDSFSLLMRRTLPWKYCYTFLLTPSRKQFGWKRNKGLIHPRQKSQWICRKKTWVETCHSHTGFWYYLLKLMGCYNLQPNTRSEVCHKNVKMPCLHLAIQDARVFTLCGLKRDIFLRLQGQDNLDSFYMWLIQLRQNFRLRASGLEGSLEPNQWSISSKFAGT